MVCRYAVIGNCGKSVKDFYIVPLASHQTIPQVSDQFICWCVTWTLMLFTCGSYKFSGFSLGAGFVNE